jgi:hypothetical protein
VPIWAVQQMPGGHVDVRLRQTTGSGTRRIHKTFRLLASCRADRFGSMSSRLARRCCRRRRLGRQTGARCCCRRTGANVGGQYPAVAFTKRSRPARDGLGKSDASGREGRWAGCRIALKRDAVRQAADDDEGAADDDDDDDEAAKRRLDRLDWSSLAWTVQGTPASIKTLHWRWAAEVAALPFTMEEEQLVRTSCTYDRRNLIRSAWH